MPLLEEAEIGGVENEDSDAESPKMPVEVALPDVQAQEVPSSR